MMQYTVKIYWGIDELIDPFNYNVDVEIIFSNGDRYSATFFTLKNIQSLIDTYKKTGEAQNGLYFWASDMIIVEKITKEIINDTVSNLLKNREFYTAFKFLSNDKKS